MAINVSLAWRFSVHLLRPVSALWRGRERLVDPVIRCTSYLGGARGRLVNSCKAAVPEELTEASYDYCCLWESARRR